jgi:alkylation response protein AidB-like acyl-CoA dehydrogenase
MSTAIFAGVDAAEFASWQALAEVVADRLRQTAVERDRANANPITEIGWLREAGLLGFAVPQRFGGAGGSLPQALQLVRIIAAADGSLGQLIAYHYSNGVWTHILGREAQWASTAQHVAKEGWFQGGVSNPRDAATEITVVPGGFRLNGVRTFATGAPVANILTVSVWHEGRLVHFEVPPDRAGITFREDWDNLGQRLTASGSIVFDNVFVADDERLSGLDSWPGVPSHRDALRSLFSQLIFVHFYLGIAEGALAAAGQFVREKGRPWPESGLSSAVDDPYHAVKLGRLSAHVAAAIALGDRAAEAYSRVLDLGTALDAESWGRLALLVDQAKVAASDAALETTADIYEVTGARSTANRYGLDIFWRNVRTHSVHDPVSYRAREIGQYHLKGQLPNPRTFTPPTA